ncbi:MAG: hypothetical protein ACFBSF_02195 [Leptolyngbyaceae cyanobacterium]
MKVWKAAGLEGETTTGVADYLIAERKRYLEAPFVNCPPQAGKMNHPSPAMNYEANNTIGCLGLYRLLRVT